MRRRLDFCVLLLGAGACLGCSNEKEKLYVWRFNSENLIKCLRQDDHSAVLEHSSFSTAVHADGEELLETLRRHASELVGTPMTFVRITSE